MGGNGGQSGDTHNNPNEADGGPGPMDEDEFESIYFLEVKSNGLRGLVIE